MAKECGENCSILTLYSLRKAINVSKKEESKETESIVNYMHLSHVTSGKKPFDQSIVKACLDHMKSAANTNDDSMINIPATITSKFKRPGLKCQIATSLPYYLFIPPDPVKFNLSPHVDSTETLNFEHIETMRASFADGQEEFEKTLGEREIRDAQIITEGLTQKDPDFGANYAGEWLCQTQTRQGLGVLRRQNGAHYQGYFVYNRFEGKGVLTYPQDEIEHL